jgi:hypothetical protein
VLRICVLRLEERRAEASRRELLLNSTLLLNQPPLGLPLRVVVWAERVVRVVDLAPPARAALYLRRGHGKRGQFGLRRLQRL